MNISNYPPGVTPDDFNELYEYKVADIEVNDIELDIGQGLQSGSLIIECEQLTNGSIELAKCCEFTAIGNNGEELNIELLLTNELSKENLEKIYNKANEEFNKWNCLQPQQQLKV